MADLEVAELDFHLVGVEVVHHLQVEDSRVDYLVADRKVEDSQDDFEVDKHGQVVDMIGLVVGDQVVLVEDSSVEGSLVVDNPDIRVVDSVDSLVVDMVDSPVPHEAVVDKVLAALVQDSPVDRLLVVVDILDILVVPVVVLQVLILEPLLDRCLVDTVDILLADS